MLDPTGVWSMAGSAGECCQCCGVSMSRGPLPDLIGLTNASPFSGGPDPVGLPDPFRHNICPGKGSGNQLHPGEIWTSAGSAKNSPEWSFLFSAAFWEFGGSCQYAAKFHAQKVAYLLR